MAVTRLRGRVSPPVQRVTGTITKLSRNKSEGVRGPVIGFFISRQYVKCYDPVQGDIE